MTIGGTGTIPGRGGVVTCVEQLAADAGAEILRAGGNAADAAIAAAFAQCVVDPIYAGIAGTFHGMFWDEEKSTAVAVSAGARAPSGARPDAWQLRGQSGAVWTVADDRNRLGYQASTIPGFIKGAAEALERCGSGRIAWKDIMAPAIRLARDGFEVYPYLYRLWMPMGEYSHGYLETMDGPMVLGLTDASREIYLHQDGTVYEIGDRLVQEDYGRTLAEVAEEGPDAFYFGRIASRMANDFQSHGGWLTLDDLKTLKADVTEPIRTTFGDLDVLNEQPPSVGPVVAELLNILEGWDLAALGWNTGPYLDHLARAMHLAFRDRLALLGDPDIVEVPLAKVVSKEYAAVLRAQIEEGTDLEVPSVERGHAPRQETTHVTVVDSAGNGAAITHSIGGCSGVVTPGLGFLYNSHMEMFDPVPGSRNAIAPRKRPLTGGGPVLFVKDGRLKLMIGSPAGARKVSAVVQAFLNMTLFDMPIEEAVAVDRIHAENEPRTVIVEPFFPPEPLLELSRMGQSIRYEWYTGRLAGVSRDADGNLAGGTDPRGGRGIAVVE